MQVDLQSSTTTIPRPAPFTFQPDVSHTKLREQTTLARYNRAIADASRSRDVATCFTLAAEMKENNIRPDITTYNNLILAVGSGTHSTDAWAIFDDMLLLGIQPNAQTFLCLLEAQRQQSSLFVWKVLDKMKEMNVEADAAIRRYVLRLFSREGSVELALEHLQAALDSGEPPDLEAIGAIVKSLAAIGYPRLAIELADSLEKQILRRLEPVVWMSCLISAADDLWAEGTLRCWQLIVQEVGMVPDEGLCLSVLNTAARHGLPDLASDVMRVLTLTGIPIQEYHYAPLIEAQCQAKDLKTVLQTLGTMRIEGVEAVPETVRPVISLFTKSIDEFDNVWSIIDELAKTEEGVDVMALNVIIKGAVKLNDLQRVVGAYQSFPEYNVSPNLDTFHAVLDGAILAAHRPILDLVLKDMKAAEIKPAEETYERFIKLCLTQDVYEDAFFYLEEMKAAGFVPSKQLYFYLVSTCCRAGDRRFVVAIEDMKDCGHTVPDTYKPDMEKQYRRGVAFTLQAKRQATIREGGDTTIGSTESQYGH